MLYFLTEIQIRMANVKKISRWISVSQRHRPDLFKDLFFISFFLLAGLTGIIYASDPIRFLRPNLPMLSTHDWSGSEVRKHLRDNSYGIPGERRFTIRLEVGNSPGWLTSSGAEIWQRAVWYSDSKKSVQAWERRDSGQSQVSRFDNHPSATIKSDNQEEPTSWFACDEISDGRRICAYFAYYGHWYTEVWFWSGGDEYLSLNEIEMITNRVNALLAGASATP